jgi:hypothetical protein
MIKKFEAFISDTNKDYEHEDIVVAIRDTLRLEIGKKYRLLYTQPDDSGNYIYVHDLYNNERIGSHKNNFVTEMEYETGEDTKKYNL